MTKQELHLERILNCTSANIVWSLISTPEGLSRWIADEVTLEGDKLTFKWGEPWRHHQVQTATLLETCKNRFIRIKWDAHDNEGTFMEIKMEKGVLDDNYALYITDFALPDEIEDQKYLWEGDFEKLHQNTGL